MYYLEARSRSRRIEVEIGVKALVIGNCNLLLLLQVASRFWIKVHLNQESSIQVINALPYVSVVHSTST